MNDDQKLRDAFGRLKRDAGPAANRVRLDRITGKPKQAAWVPVFAVVLLIPVAVAGISRLSRSADPGVGAADTTTTTTTTAVAPTPITTTVPTQNGSDPFGFQAAESWRAQCMDDLGHQYVASTDGFSTPFDIWFDGELSPYLASVSGFDARYFVRPPGDEGAVRSAQWWQAWDICESQVHQESPLVHPEDDVYQLHSDTMASSRVVDSLAVFQGCMTDRGIPDINEPGDAELLIRSVFLDALERAETDGRVPGPTGQNDLEELIGQAIEDMKFIETEYAEAEFTCLQPLELTYNEVWANPGERQASALLPVIPEGSGPSQSLADAQRDGIVPELAEFPIHERITLQETFRPGTLTLAETEEGVWAISRIYPAVAPGCGLGDTSGQYGRDFVCTVEYGELLLLSPDLSTVIRAYPFPGLPPQWLMIDEDSVWCGRQGDGGLPSSMLCRIDRVSGELTAREFWLRSLDGFSEFGPDGGIEATTRPGTWFSSPTSEIYFGSPEFFNGELMLGGAEHIDAVDVETLLLGRAPGTATLRIVEVRGVDGGIEASVLARESDITPLDFILRDGSGQFLEGTYSGSRTAGTTRGEGYTVPLSEGHRTESGWIWVKVRITELDPGSYELLVGRSGVTFFQAAEVTPANEVVQSRPPSVEANEIALSLLRFVDSDSGVLDLADEVTLRLGTEIRKTVSREDLLTDPDAWVFNVEDYNASTGPFNILETLAQPPFVEILEGPIPHCASPPKDYWPEVILVRSQINITPAGIDSCLQWLVVILRVNADGQIQEVILDVWEP